MIDVLTPFGLSVVYLTTDAMPSGSWVVVTVASAMTFFLRQCSRSRLKNPSTSKPGSPSISIRGSVAAASKKTGGGMLASGNDQFLNSGRPASRASAMQRQSIAITRAVTWPRSASPNNLIRPDDAGGDVGAVLGWQRVKRFERLLQICRRHFGVECLLNDRRRFADGE